MSFTSGRVTFTRFRVAGDAPTACDDALLSILTEHRFQERDIGKPEEVEVGFVTAEHLLDTRFTAESCFYGKGIALFALRLDTHKVPTDVKHAHYKINEQAAAAGSPTGLASRTEKREAREAAGRSLDKDLADGMYRKSASYQVMWDLESKTLYLNATSGKAIEHLVRLMRMAFAVELHQLTAGVLAGAILRELGKMREFEDLAPSSFTDPPAQFERGPDDARGWSRGDHPPLPWVAKSSDLADWIGNEFLIWLWWLCETNDGMVGDVHVVFSSSLDMDCAWGVGGRQALRGDIVGGGPTKLKEAGNALATGKWPRRAGLLLAQDDTQVELTLQGDSFAVTAAMLPQIEDAASPRELTMHRLLLIHLLGNTLDTVYRWFLKDRTASSWASKRTKIRRWIETRSK